jgi:hypothetical protein
MLRNYTPNPAPTGTNLAKSIQKPVNEWATINASCCAGGYVSGNGVIYSELPQPLLVRLADSACEKPTRNQTMQRKERTELT